jgi:hypothetical protein
MPLDAGQRAELVRVAVAAMPVHADFRTFVDAIRLGAWTAAVPIDATLVNAVAAIVRVAGPEGWERDFVAALADRFPARAEFKNLLASIDRADTAVDPFDEVLLGGSRPFADRRELRNHLRSMATATGETVLLLDGAPQTGKSFSYYLLNHAATRRGFVVNRFSVAMLPRADELADEILRHLGVANPVIPPQGPESAERWADKLAHAVKQTIESQSRPRFFLFDQFPPTPPPPETVSFIARLATFSDQELRDLLRVVLVRFPGQLPPDVEDVALRDDTRAIGNTDMLEVLMKIAKARRWKLDDTTANAKILEFNPANARSTRECFQFLRRLVQVLEAAAQKEGMP